MAECSATISLDDATGGQVHVVTTITSDAVGLEIHLGGGTPVTVPLDQVGNRQAVRRLADSLFEAYRSVRDGGK